jgi:hypothetical protein
MTEENNVVDASEDVTPDDRVDLLDDVLEVQEQKIADLYNQVAELQQKFTTLQQMISPMVMRLAQTMPGGAPQLVDEQEVLIRSRANERRPNPPQPIRYGAKRS